MLGVGGGKGKLIFYKQASHNKTKTVQECDFLCKGIDARKANDTLGCIRSIIWERIENYERRWECSRVMSSLHINTWRKGRGVQALSSSVQWQDQRRFLMNVRNNSLYYENDCAVAQVAQRSSGISILGDSEKPSGQGPREPALYDPAWAQTLYQMTSRTAF